MSAENDPFRDLNNPEEPIDPEVEDRLTVYAAQGAMMGEIAKNIFTSDQLPEGDILRKSFPVAHVKTLIGRTGGLLDVDLERSELTATERYAYSRARDVLDLVSSVTDSYSRVSSDVSVGVLLGATMHVRVSEIMRLNDITLYSAGVKELEVGVPRLVEVLRFAMDFPEE
jgi:hypothetical protein